MTGKGTRRFLCAQDWCSPNYTSISSTTFLGNGDTIFLSRRGSIFIFLLHVTIVHKEESRERLCDLANGMREVHSLREETILFLYSCIYLAFFAFCFLFGMFQNTRAGGGDTVCSPGRSVCVLGSFEPVVRYLGRVKEVA